MFILGGTKAVVVGRDGERELEVSNNCYAAHDEYVLLNDGWEYVVEEFDGEIVYVRS